VLVGGLVAGAAATGVIVFSSAPAQARGDNPQVIVSRSPTQTSVRTVVIPGSNATLPRPVAVPSDSYAPEPIVPIGWIDIPKIQLHHPIFHGITLRNIDQGPSHWPGTAMPGENGNAVFAGHRVTHTHPFLRINELVPGDTVTFSVTVPGAPTVVSNYVVTSAEVVTPDDLAIVDQTSTPTATLFACHPPHWATYRYVVHLAMVANS